MEFENKVVCFELKFKQEEINSLVWDLEQILKKYTSNDELLYLYEILKKHKTDVNSSDITTKIKRRRSKK